MEIAIFIKQSTFIVESMSDLVPDHDANSTVI